MKHILFLSICSVSLLAYLLIDRNRAYGNTHENLWKQICKGKALLSDENTPSSIYKAILRDELTIPRLEACPHFENNEWAITLGKNFSPLDCYKEAIKKIGNPHLTYDIDSTIKNYESFYQSLGTKDLERTKKILYNEIKSYFILKQPYIVHYNSLYIVSLYDKYSDVNYKLTQNKDYLGKYAIMVGKNKEEEIADIFWKDSFKLLDASTFFTLIKEFIRAIHQAFFAPYEYFIEENDGSFKKRVEDSLYPNSIKEKIAKYFSIVIELAQQFLADHGVSEDNRRSLTKVELEWPITSKDTYFKSTILDENAHYVTKNKKILVYGGYANQSDGKIFSSLAHEYGHAIDDFLTKDSIFSTCIEHVKSCLQKVVPLERNNLVDRTGEGFADWFAAYILAKYLQNNESSLNKKGIKSFIDEAIILTCKDEKDYNELSLLGMDPHPRWDMRTNNIYGAHPYIKNFYNLKYSMPFCECTESSQALHREE